MLLVLKCICLIWILNNEMAQMCWSAPMDSFECGNSICNTGAEYQYCSQDSDMKCIPCRDVERYCFKSEMEYNCTKHCLDWYKRSLRDKPCSRLGNVSNGRHNGTVMSTQDDVIKVTCDTGYHVVGYSTIRCLIFGIWSDELPICKRINCGPPVVAHGIVLDSFNWTFGSIAEYRCDDGYIGADTEAVCQASGLWHPLNCTQQLVKSDNSKSNVTWMAIAITSLSALTILVLIIIIISRYVYRVYKEESCETSEMLIEGGTTFIKSNKGLYRMSESQSQETKLLTFEDDVGFHECSENSSAQPSGISNREKEPNSAIHLIVNIGDTSITKTVPVNTDIGSSGGTPTLESQTARISAYENDTIKHPVQVSEITNIDNRNTNYAPHSSTNIEIVSEASDCSVKQVLDITNSDNGNTDDAPHISTNIENVLGACEYSTNSDSSRSTSPIRIYRHASQPSDGGGRIAIIALNSHNIPISDLK